MAPRSGFLLNPLIRCLRSRVVCVPGGALIHEPLKLCPGACGQFGGVTLCHLLPLGVSSATRIASKGTSFSSICTKRCARSILVLMGSINPTCLGYCFRVKAG